MYIGGPILYCLWHCTASLPVTNLVPEDNPAHTHTITSNGYTASVDQHRRIMPHAPSTKVKGKRKLFKTSRNLQFLLITSVLRYDQLCVRARACSSCITYTVCANYPFTYHNFELASFPGFPLLLSRESLARPMETSRDQ